MFGLNPALVGGCACGAGRWPGLGTCAKRPPHRAQRNHPTTVPVTGPFQSLAKILNSLLKTLLEVTDVLKNQNKSMINAELSN